MDANVANLDEPPPVAILAAPSPPAAGHRRSPPSSLVVAGRRLRALMVAAPGEMATNSGGAGCRPQLRWPPAAASIIELALYLAMCPPEAHAGSNKKSPVVS